MAIGEILLSAFFQVLFDRLASRELLKFVGQLPGGFDSDLKNWEKNLKMIQAVLDDAEDKQLTDKAVKLWLDDLQDLACDVADILDELSTEALKRKSRLEQLCKQKMELGLQSSPGGTLSSTDAMRRPPSSSVPTDRVLYGRDEDKANVLTLVSSDGASNDANIFVIPFVGKVGIEKTTLARDVHNDKVIEDFN